MPFDAKDRAEIAEIVRTAILGPTVGPKPSIVAGIDVSSLGAQDAGALMKRLKDILGPAADQCCNGCD